MKLTDFWLSNSWIKKTAYTAPEIQLERTFTADWWAAGVILREMLFAEVPLIGGTSKGFLERIGKVGTQASDAAVSLIKVLLQNDPKNRLGQDGAGKVKAHPFFVEKSPSI